MSHRWSPQPSLLLSKDTMDELRQGFNAARLPAVIRDATSVCKRLGVRYLWVDTLCILQDDEDLTDWKRESSFMGKVYENSLLNLSALAAADTEHPLFAERNPRAVNELRVNTSLKLDVLELGNAVNEYQLVDNDFWHANINRTPLNKRAWVMQERLLAVRVLHFGHHQLLWECAALKAAETYPNGLPAHVETSLSLIRINQQYDLDFRQIAGEGALQKLLQNKNNIWNAGFSNDSERIYSLAYDIWNYDVVCAYSHCKATKGSDKLVAISGLAKKMASILDDQYVVGMWRRRLPWHLMWRCDQVSEAECPGPRRPKASYRAPSFSWASVDTIVKPGNYQPWATSCIRIKDVKLDFVVTNDPTGQCKGGHLTIACRLQRAHFTHPKQPTEPISRKYHITGSGGSMVDRYPHLDELPGYFEPVGRDDLYSVAWEYRHFHDSDGRDPTRLRCEYLLFQAIDPSAGIFQRVGTAWCYYNVEDFDCMEQRISDGPEAANYPCLKYEDGWHTINVI